MRLSIKYKATLPVLNVAVLVLLLGGVSAWFLQKIHAANQSLSHRFHEIEEVREIEAAISSLVLPLQQYVASQDPQLKTDITKKFHQINDMLDDLSKMAVVNQEEHEMIKFVSDKMESIKVEVDKLLALPVTQKLSATSRLIFIEKTYLTPLNARLDDWHRGEVKQVDQVAENAASLLSEFIWISLAMFLILIVTIILSLLTHSRILIKPLMQVVRGIEDLAQGNLQQRITISTGDEISLLASRINEMANKITVFQKNMEKIAVTDQLTGLMNRHALPEIFDRECNRAKRNGTGVAIILMDIDHFKAVNDTYGHPAGDNVLRHIAAVCTTVVREYDYVFRYGGEEYLLLLPVSSKNNVAGMAERIRDYISRTPWVHETGNISLTASFGVAYFPEDGESPGDIIKKADDALYHAKKTGRNRVCVYPVSNSSTTQH